MKTPQTIDQTGERIALNQIRWIRKTFRVGEGMGGLSRRQLLASWAQRAREVVSGKPLHPMIPLVRVVVEVLGGVAEVTTCPPGVEVEIVDHDNNEAEGE